MLWRHIWKKEYVQKSPNNFGWIDGPKSCIFSLLGTNVKQQRKSWHLSYIIRILIYANSGNKASNQKQWTSSWTSSWIFLPFFPPLPAWNEHIESIQWRLVEFKGTGIKTWPHVSKSKINISFLLPKPQGHLLQTYLRKHVHKSPILWRGSPVLLNAQWVGVPLSCQDFLNKNGNTKVPDHFWFFSCGESGQKVISEFPP